MILVKKVLESLSKIENRLYDSEEDCYFINMFLKEFKDALYDELRDLWSQSIDSFGGACIFNEEKADEILKGFEKWIENTSGN